MATPFTADQPFKENNVINESERDSGTPANDSGKLVQLEADGVLHSAFLGAHNLTDSSDGELNVSSGTTNIDLASSRVVVKRYNEISITGTGKVTFSNPHVEGTTIILLCHKVTITSSTSPAIDASGLGATGGSGISKAPDNSRDDGSDGTKSKGFSTHFPAAGKGGTGGADAGGAGGTITELAFLDRLNGFFPALLNFISPGAGGGGGAMHTFSTDATVSSSGAGGRGGAGLAIISSGEWNVTGDISVSGANGEDATNPSATIAAAYGGGGGGGGGSFFGLYRILEANTGTVTVSGGVGGTGIETGTTGVRYSGGGGGASIASNGSSSSVSGVNGAAGGDGASIVSNGDSIL